MCRVILSGPLREAVGGQTEIQVDAADLSLLAAALRTEHPDLADRVLQEDGLLRPHVNLFINGRLHPSKSVEPVPLSGSDEVLILPAVSGG